MKYKFLFFTLALFLFCSFVNNAYATEIYFSNDTKYKTIRVAIFINREDRGWVSEGWWDVNRGMTVKLPYETFDKFYLYAYTYKDNELIEWAGNANDFNDIRRQIIEGLYLMPAHKYPQGRVERKVVFKSFDLKNNNTMTFRFNNSLGIDLDNKKYQPHSPFR